MRTPLHLTPEAPDPSPPLSWDPDHDGLAPRDRLILEFHLLSMKPSWIATKLSASLGVVITPQSVSQRLARPEFKAAVRRIETAHMEKIARGEFGAMALVKAELTGSLRRIIGMAKASEDDRVKLNANLKLVELAGFQPPTPIAHENPERIIDMMGAEELKHFYETGEFPGRLADQLSRLTSNVLAKAEKARWTPRVEQIGEGEDPRIPPARDSPVEIEEDLA